MKSREALIRLNKFRVDEIRKRLKSLDDMRGDLTKKIPFLKGSRIAFRVENVLNDYIKVRDNTGATPLSYQRGFLDPQGRVFELSFRKRF